MHDSDVLLAGGWALLFGADTPASSNNRGDGRAARRATQTHHDADVAVPLSVSDEFVQGIRAQDERTFKELVVRWSPGMFRFAAQLVHSNDVAEDLVQDVLYRVWQLGDRFDPKGSLQAYLFAAVRNRALDWLGHERIVERAQSVLDADLRASDGWSSAEDPTTQADARIEGWEKHVVALRLALQTLTEHQRSAIDLRYNQGLTIPEIARVLGISPKGVEQLMTRIRKLLREKVLEGDN